MEKIIESKENKIEYTEVNINEFFDGESDPSAQQDDGQIVIFTEHQKQLVEMLLENLQKLAPEKYSVIKNRISNLESLAKSISFFPSLLERINTTSSVRTPDSLVENLISYQHDGDAVLHMPSKATLGKGFLVSKIHTFYSMSKLAKNNANMSESLVKEYTDETVSMMFTLMAEDVYMNLIHDSTLPMNLRRQLANSLIILWEHRTDQTMTDIAPVLQTVWQARRTLAPAFGTMMGTSELLLVSIQMDSDWREFLKQKLEIPEVSQAMEEFLFGLSHEQISRLRNILKNQGVKSIGRDEVSKYLGERVKTDVSLDYRDFYLLYTVRRDNARARKRFKMDGPKNTLEDFFIRFVLEQNELKQINDSFAKSGEN